MFKYANGVYSQISISVIHWHRIPYLQFPQPHKVHALGTADFRSLCCGVTRVCTPQGEKKNCCHVFRKKIFQIIKL